MDALTILNNNYEMQNNSFLYYLREKNIFNKDAFKQLNSCIYDLAQQNVSISSTALKIHIIHARTLEAFLYHFDANDTFNIQNLPENYNKILAQLDKSVAFYFQTRI